MPDFASKAVFLSYASQDVEAARRICEALRACGIEVWFDRSELRGGDVWDQKIKKQIRECALFLPVISAHTNARAEGYFRLEWKLAVDRSHLMADDAAFLVPTVIDEMNDAAARVPDKFREVQWTRVLTAEAATAFAGRVRALLSAECEPATAATPPAAPTAAWSGAKAKRAVVAGAESGWRPAPGLTVPGTNWTIEAKIGEGGFGEVWLGVHQAMKERRVFKFCFEAERVHSLRREITLFRLLKERVGAHPNIVRLLDVHFDAPPFYVEMDYVEGQSLKNWCEQQGGVQEVPMGTRLELIAQAADALHAAHSAGVIHRDVKPGNILVAQGSAPGAAPVAKLSDFGIGQVISDEVLAGMTKSGFSKSIVVDAPGANSGTQLYMAPELLVGEPATARSDLYSLGVVLFQLATGDFNRPLTTDWQRAIKDDLLREDLAKCFAGRPEERFESSGQFAESVRAIEQRRAARQVQEAAAATREAAARRWKLVRSACLTALLVGFGASAVWFWRHNSRLRWAREVALPEIARLIKQDDLPAAFTLACEVEKFLPNDPALTGLWPQISIRATVQTAPAGADIYIKPYRKPSSEWQHLGKSPVKGVRVARDLFRWQIRKDGFAPLEKAQVVAANNRFELEAEEAAAPGMIRIPAGEARVFALTGLQHMPFLPLGSFHVDRHEVTNREFKAFVDRGGYSSERFWKQPFVRDGKELAWKDAIAGFRDTTGHPGPATWRSGAYPEGEADFPVTGVSWFEAAAYAESVGKRLPSLYHWSSAATPVLADAIVPLSNFSGRGIARAGSFQGMSLSGACDMAGNAKEWCWNEAGSGKRYVLGGAWREPEYMFTVADAMSPFDRSSSNGFRCIRLAPDEVLAPGVDAPAAPQLRNYANEKPVSDDTFRIYKSLFSYDKTELDSRIDAIDESSGLWRKERVSFAAAYGNERVTAYVFLPKNSPPPYQTVILFPGSGAIYQTSSGRLQQGYWIDVILGNRRAAVYPIYKGTYERRDGLQTIFPSPTSAYRDHVVQWSKDLGRTIDYLETRPDIQADKLAYLGVSWGASMGALLPAVENRLKASALMVGGLYGQTTLPEVDQINFAPRVSVPTLMINGRYDGVFPVESSQNPLYDFLGTPKEHKKRVLLDTGHNVTGNVVYNYVLEWLDKYLGPVK